jgi:hypothetical protein
MTVMLDGPFCRLFAAERTIEQDHHKWPGPRLNRV